MHDFKHISTAFKVMLAFHVFLPLNGGSFLKNLFSKLLKPG